VQIGSVFTFLLWRSYSNKEDVGEIRRFLVRRRKTQAATAYGAIEDLA
jgi:hypothetical protein